MNKTVTSWNLALLGAVLLCAAPAWAQYEDDEKLDDYADQDRRYLERLQKPKDDAPELSPGQDEAVIFARVETLIRDRNYSAADSDHFRVQTDDPRVDAKAVTRLLESFRDHFEAFWKDRLPLAPYDKKSRAFLFYSFYKYNQLLEGDFRFSLQRPKGHYGSLFDAITLHTDAGDPGDLADTLIHEVTHQMVEQRLNTTAGFMPPWLGEGLASYFGYMHRDKNGVFTSDATGGKAIGLFRDGKVRNPGRPSAGLRSVRRALKSGDSDDSLYETLLLVRDPDVFYGSGAELNYNASWLLVHYLFHGAEGAHADAFVRYLALRNEDRGGPEVLMKELGMTYAALDAEVARHASKIKTR